MKKRHGLCPLGAAAALLLATGALAAERDTIGEAFREFAEAKGTVDVRGETIDDGAIFLSVSTAAIVHLENGRVVRLQPNSAVRFDAVAQGEVQVTVLAGQLATIDERARVLRAGAGSVFRLAASLAPWLDVERALVEADLDPDAATGRLPAPRAVARSAAASR